MNKLLRIYVAFLLVTAMVTLLGVPLGTAQAATVDYAVNCGVPTKPSSIPSTVNVDCTPVKDHFSDTANRQKAVNLVGQMFSKTKSALSSSALGSMKPDLTLVAIVPVNYMTKYGCGNALGCYVQAENPTLKFLMVDENEFLSTSEVSSTIVHELIHSYIANNRDFAGSTGASQSAQEAYQEMFTEYHANRLFSGVAPAYDKLVALVPSFLDAIKAAEPNQDADLIWQKAMLSGSLSDIDALFAPYLTNKNFITQLGRYISSNNGSGDTQQGLAQNYLQSVTAKVNQVKNGTCATNTATPGDEVEPPVVCTPNAAGTTGITIMSVSPDDPTPGSITVSWKTATPMGAGKVRFGTRKEDSALVQATYEEDTTPHTDHTVVVTPTTGQFDYYFRVVQPDPNNAATALEVSAIGDLVLLNGAGGSGTFSITDVSVQKSGLVAVVSWKTTVPATRGKVRFGARNDDTSLTNAEYEPTDKAASTDHSVRITVPNEAAKANALYYRIVQENDGNPVYSSIQRLFNPGTGSSDITSVSVTKNGGGSWTISWKTTSSLSGGKVRYGTTSSDSDTDKATFEKGDAATSHSVTITGLDGTKQYYYSIIYGTGSVRTNRRPLQAETLGEDPGSFGADEVVPGCYFYTGANGSELRKGVLIKYEVDATRTSSNKVFICYIDAFIRDNTAIIVTIAVLSVVYYGVVYMLSGIGGDQKKAKERILIIVYGILFFTLIRLLLIILSPVLKI